MILKKAKGIHIDGRKKMSRELPLREYLDPKFVYIPLIQQSVQLKPVVEIGNMVKIGQIVAMREGFGTMPIHASISGKVTSIKKVWHISGRMVEALEIENDGENRLDDAIQPEKDVSGLTREQLIEKMQKAGLSGLGGAGFPTYIKYQTACKIDTVIINAVECEPYLTCDCMLTIQRTEKLLKGLGYLMRAADASNGVLAIKSYNRNIIEAIQPLLTQYPSIRIHEIKDLYPAGWEKYVVEQVTGKTYKKLPAEIGVIVNNSATAIAFVDMVENNIPLISRVVTISGEGIKKPQNFQVPIGTRVAELVEMCGGYVEGLDPKNAWYIAGGPMTGKAILIDDLIVNDTLNAVLVIEIPPTRENPECLGCGKCADVCPVYLTPTAIKNAFDRKDVKLIGDLAADRCMSCGLCSYVCPSHIEITDYVLKAKDLLRKGA